MKTLFRILFVLFCVGCSGGDNNIFKIIEKPDLAEINLTCHDSIILPNVSNVWYWKFDNNRLYTFSAQNPDVHFLSIYSCPDFKLLYKYGTIGQGSDEFITVNWANTYNKNEIVLYDIMKKKLYPFKVSDSLVKKMNTFNLAKIKGEKLAKPFTMVHQINDSIFLMKVNMPDSITLEIADLKNNRQISSYTRLPQVKDIKRGLLSFLYDFELEYRDNAIVCAFKSIDRIEILQIDDEYNITHKLTIGSKKLPTEYIRDSDGGHSSFYTDIKCNGKYIFAVCQDKKNKSTIEIYDLEGNGISKLCLDHYVEIIFISPDSNYIYAYYQLVNYDVILKYEIPK
ncbi:MAG: hypothetical protein LBS55_06650 [Prevotellaceae bacterium]|nr:hypothetical protein [Prevotellaceae bacterium]